MENSPLLDPGLYESGNWKDTFRALRRDQPVSWQKLGSDDGFWAVTKYRDIVCISNDPDTWSSASGGVFLYDQPAGLEGALLTTDPPDHTRLRKAVGSFFNASGVKRLSQWLREESHRLIASAGEKRFVNFVYDVAADLPLNTIGTLLAIDDDKRAQLLAMADELIASGANGGERAAAAVTELGKFGLDLARVRRASDGADLVSAMLRAGGENRLSDREFSGMFVQLTGAATETTRSMLTQIIIMLARDEKLFRSLQNGSVDLRLAIEECLRWMPPVNYMRRTATRDTMLGGVPIRAGDKVAMYYSSGNFDEEIFDNAEVFEPERRPNRHLTFGVGEHVCIGIQLARQELLLFLEEFVANVRSVRLTGEPTVVFSPESTLVKDAPMEIELK